MISQDITVEFATRNSQFPLSNGNNRIGLPLEFRAITGLIRRNRTSENDRVARRRVQQSKELSYVDYFKNKIGRFAHND